MDSKECESKQDEVDDACSTNEERINLYRAIVGKSEGKRQLGRSRCTSILHNTILDK
jgi:hypothetical protein